MGSTGWISLNDYANKYGVSVSTLRRKIKKVHVEFELRYGKYWLKDTPLGQHEPRRGDAVEASTVIAPAFEIRTEPNQDGLESLSQASLNNKDNRPPTPNSDFDASILNVTNDLLGELKKAYMQVLQEKEEQILLLKTEIDDLRTLVKVLEEDNLRMREEQRASLSNAVPLPSKKEMAEMTFLEKEEERAPHFASSESWLELE